MTDPTPTPLDETAPPPDDTDVPPDTGLPLDKIRRYRLLREHQAASEAEATAFKDEANALEAELVDAFTDAGMQNISIDGKTVYLHRTVYAQWTAGLDTEAKKAALRNAGAEDLITETVNAQTVSAWVRELTEDDDAPGLPSELDGMLSAGERFSIRINAAGSRKKSKTHSK